MLETVNEAALRLPAYGRLLDARHVVPSARTDYVAVDRHLFTKLMARCLTHIEVDEAWYLMNYPDIRHAVTAGVVRSVQEHYAQFGYFEHRMPYGIEVDEDWYLAAHPDVKEAIDQGHYASAQEHYEMDGFREGRLPYPGFELFS